MKKPGLYLNLILVAMLISACGAMTPNPAPVSSAAAPVTEDKQPGLAGEQPAPEKPVDEQGVKISVLETGLYRLTRAELEKLGAGSVLEAPETWRLIENGAEIKFWIEGSGRSQRLLFIGQPGDSLYSRERVYQLLPEAIGQRLAGEALNLQPLDRLDPEYARAESYLAGAGLPENAGMTSVRLEENERYLPQAEGVERWFWHSLAAPNTLGLDIDLPDLAENSVDGAKAQVRIALWASTASQPIDPDHHMQVLINGELVLDERWDGQGRRWLNASFPANVLKQRDNQIELNVPGDTGVAAEITHLDWVALDYPAKLQATEDRLVFRSQAGERLLSGFDGEVRVWEIGNPDEPQPVNTAEEGRADRMTAEDGRSYLAVGEQGELAPAGLQALHLEPDLRSLDGGDYLVIGPAELLEAAQPLLEWRRTDGFQVVAVPFEAVRDQFGYSYPAPDGIERLVRYASENWSEAPKYVLLIGDGTYDPRGYQAPSEANRLPIFFVDTVYGGQTASDVGFVQLDEDAWPDLPLGRLPARTPQDVATAATKIIAYEQSAAQLTGGTGILAIADGQEGHFQAEAQAFIDQFNNTLTSDLYTPPPGTNDAPAEIMRRLADDPLLVAYFGHGSVNMWGKDHLFSVEDVGPAPGQDRLPVVINMTCLNGLFTHPEIESLAERLVWEAQGGAVAVLAPSSLTLPGDQSYLSRAFVDAFVNQPEARLGDVHLAARQAVPVESDSAWDVMATFMLFGDPALKVPRSGAINQ